jgi:pyrimidine operon attenuation protein/uracil phosphoribosyltransferase
MIASPTLVIGPADIERRIERLAYQILEENYAEPTIWLAGVAGQGSQLAHRLCQHLRRIAPFAVVDFTVLVDKKASTQPAILLDTVQTAEMEGGVVVLVDDVLNTGRTLMYALAPFTEIPLKRLQLAVLVERGHRAFPISATFAGMALSTTIEDHIHVWLEGESTGVWLH